MTSGYIDSGTQKLHYLQWRGGGRLLVCFHGYGNNAGLFAGLAGQVQQQYTTISFDLPHHGRSSWEGEHPWRKRDLAAMIRELMAHHGVDRLSLAGFSMGGRICLTLAQLMPGVIDELVLMAPDGLVPNGLYRFMTSNTAGKKIFYHLLDKPEKYMGLLGWLEQRRFIDAARRKFVEYYMGMPAARAFLRKVWPNLRRIVPDQRKVKRYIEQYAIPTHLFMGRYDHVIPVKHARTFAAGSQHIRVHVLEKGHRVLDEGSTPVIAKSFRAL